MFEGLPRNVQLPFWNPCTVGMCFTPRLYIGWEIRPPNPLGWLKCKVGNGGVGDSVGWVRDQYYVIIFQLRAFYHILRQVVKWWWPYCRRNRTHIHQEVTRVILLSSYHLIRVYSGINIRRQDEIHRPKSNKWDTPYVKWILIRRLLLFEFLLISWRLKNIECCLKFSPWPVHLLMSNQLT